MDIPAFPLFKYLWIAFIIVPFINYFIIKARFKETIDAKPELKDGYDKISKAILIISVIPWIIVGIGNSFQSTQSILEYFNPKTFNPFVLAFHFYIIIVFILVIWWIFVSDGATFLSRHPGFIRFKGLGTSGDITSPLYIKLFFGLCLAGGIAALTMMWVMDFPFPPKV